MADAIDLEAELRRLMIAIARDMVARRFITATEGNLSTRLDPERLLITPTSTNKGRLTENQLVVVDRSGRVLEGRGQPSSEIDLHLTVYRERPDVNAVVHAHPPMATAFTVAGVELAQRTLPEIVVLFGSIPTAPYGTPTTPELAKTVEGLVRDANALLLEKHGSLTLGRTLVEAYENLERVEWAAEVTLWARLLGKVEPLPDAQMEKLLAIRAEKAAVGSSAAD
ncbi:MAG: class II aldolase/adducin family protein [Planctomycetes bacterium]|nr:class II aldolase/adducin family protein [Planctomycetota bacterium]